MSMPKTAALLFLLPALLLGACGQPTVDAPPVVVAPVASTLSLRVFIPAKSGVSSQYVSSATSSLRVQLGSFDTSLALSAANCTVAAGGQNCTFSLNVAPGTGQTLTVSAYDASSHLLGTSTQTVSILAGQDNPLALTLTGVATSATFSPTNRATDITAGAAGSLLLDLGGSYSVGIALKDAAGQTILNPGRPTETVTSSNSSFAVSSTGTGTFTVMAPDPTGTAQSTTLSIKSADGTVLTTQTLTVPAQNVVLSLSNPAPVAGSSILATARLTSARGQALPVSGRVVTFGTTNGGFPGGTPIASTDAAGVASLNILTGTVSSSTGTVTSTNDSVIASSSFTSVVGTANTTTSSVLLSPNAVKVGGLSTLSVTLRDGNNNPITTAPDVTVTGATTLGTASQSGNVFTYVVAAAVAPETSSFTVKSDGNTVGAANLAITAYPLVVSEGGAALSSGSQYNFQDGNAHTFAVTETNHPNPFSVSSSNTAAATASISGGVLTVTPNTTAGFSTITVTDTFGQSFSFTVSVTTASLTIN
jgi:hypothetical protein